MKRIKYYLAALLAGTLILSSCSDSYFDINTSPNDPTDVVPALVLPAALAGNAFVFGGYYLNLGGFWTQQYVQSPSASQWADLESYNLTESDYDRQFSSMYAGCLLDYQYIRNKTAPTANWKYYAIATLMQSYSFETMADLYDQVPFTEALQGIKYVQPHYEAGAVIYDSLFARINDAVSKDFTLSSCQSPDSSDLLFYGDMDKWTQFANTLKLKMYMRYSTIDTLPNGTDGNRHKAEILALLAENNFLNADVKFTAFKDGQYTSNPFYNTFVDRLSGNVALNTTLATFLNNASDNRLKSMFNASVTGGLYSSVATGASPNIHGTTLSNYATPKITSTTPVYFFTKEESLFLQAEAQYRYGSHATAQTLFTAGVNASLVANGLASGAVTYPFNGIQSIMEQKWVASTNKRSLEAFFDMNRTGYPNIMTQSISSVLNPGERPQRLFFPQGEQQTNANTPTRVPLTTKVWWGK
jgi:hypothetical protein